MISKINFTVNQLVAADLFLGYHVSNWNPRINYFLIGKYKNTNIFNINYTYVTVKNIVSIISDSLLKKCHVWLVNENFPFFSRSPEFSRILSAFPELFFFNTKWYKGLLSNYKYVSLVRPSKFPHLVFAPNMQNNHYIINECFIINIPSFSVSDSMDNPTNVFYPIPGNSKSVRSLYFLYLLISKSSLYARYNSSSSFIFSCYNKAKKTFKNSLTSVFLKNYFSVLLKPRLLEDKILSLRLGSKLLRLVGFSRKKKKKLSIDGKKVFLDWSLVLPLFANYFVNLLNLSFLNLLTARFPNNTLKVSFLKTVVRLVKN
jgi:ribosomal protein S2